MNLKSKYTEFNALCRASLALTTFVLALTSLHVRASNTESAEEQVRGAECVIALHGLARRANSMKKLVETFSDEGYLVANIDYPSREKTVDELAELAVPAGLETCRQQGATKIHFVSHSMGGILIRKYLDTHSIENLGRVVMLAPPNQGSEVVDGLRDAPGFELLNGPAGLQLGTGPDDVPRSLGEATFDVGIIAGTSSINLLLSTYLPDPDDGKVSVESARLAGMCDFLMMDVSHPFIMKDDDAIEEVHYYLANGRFSDGGRAASATLATELLPKTHATTQATSQQNATPLPSHCTHQP